MHLMCEVRVYSAVGVCVAACVCDRVMVGVCVCATLCVITYVCDSG